MQITLASLTTMELAFIATLGEVVQELDIPCQPWKLIDTHTNTKTFSFYLVQAILAMYMDIHLSDLKRMALQSQDLLLFGIKLLLRKNSLRE